MLAYAMGHQIDTTDTIRFEKSAQNVVNSIGPGALQIFCTFMCFYVSTLACKLWMQKMSFCIPLYLSIPTTATIIGLQCEGALPHFPIKGYQWICKDLGEEWTLLVIAAIWMVSLLWVGGHIWFHSHEKLAKTER